jgi:flagellar hook protein FlgE
MMRSLFSAVSGLKAHQTKMDVIGNNIANVNTVAYKSQSVTFSDVYYQTTQTASGPSQDGGKGGTNAKQIGLGSTVAGISTAITTQGATERTDNTWDLCISGDAFFVISNAGSTYFTRSGDFSVDESGALVTSGGANVMGWLTDDDGNVVKDKVQALYPQSEEFTYTAPVATTGVSLTGNIEASDSEPATTTFSFYDSLGNRYQATLKITLDTTNDPSQTGVQKYNLEAGAVTKNGEKTNLTFTTSGGFSFNSKTGAAMEDTNADISVTFSTTTVNGTDYVDCTNDVPNIGAGANGGVIKLNACGVTMYEDPDGTNLKDSMGISYTMLADGSPIYDANEIAGSSTNTACVAGKAVGTMTAVGVDDKGCIVASYSNGDTRTIGQIAVATFTNPAGLEKVGENMYSSTMNSGEFNGIGVSIDSTGGKISSGYLEMSNVDLSDQFTSMITTQRGFQANSRIITVSDTMLEELINLKR